MTQQNMPKDKFEEIRQQTDTTVVTIDDNTLLRNGVLMKKKIQAERPYWPQLRLGEGARSATTPTKRVTGDR